MVDLPSLGRLLLLRRRVGVRGVVVRGLVRAVVVRRVGGGRVWGSGSWIGVYRIWGKGRHRNSGRECSGQSQGRIIEASMRARSSAKRNENIDRYRYLERWEFQTIICPM